MCYTINVVDRTNEMCLRNKRKGRAGTLPFRYLIDSTLIGAIKIITYILKYWQILTIILVGQMTYLLFMNK